MARESALMSTLDQGSLGPSPCECTEVHTYSCATSSDRERSSHFAYVLRGFMLFTRYCTSTGPAPDGTLWGFAVLLRTFGIYVAS